MIEAYFIGILLMTGFFCGFYQDGFLTNFVVAFFWPIALPILIGRYVASRFK